MPLSYFWQRPFYEKGFFLR